MPRKHYSAEEIENLYSQVGRLTTQLEWLKKNLQESCHISSRKAMVGWDTKDPHLTIKAQARLLSVNHTGLYSLAKKCFLQELFPCLGVRTLSWTT